MGCVASFGLDMRWARLAQGETLLRVCAVARSHLQVPDADDTPVSWGGALGVT